MNNNRNNGGPIQNTNYSSLDNPLKYPEPLYRNYTNQYPIDTMSRQNNGYEQPPPAPSPRQSQMPPPPPPQQYQQNYEQPPQQYDLQSYQYQQPPPPQQQQQQQQYDQNYQQPPPPDMQQYDQQQGQYPPYSPRQYKKDSEIRMDVENYNKQVYKRALDQQVAEKQSSKMYQEQERKQNELAMIPQYPFGRRTNPSYVVDQQPPPSQQQQQQGGYVPSFNNYNSYRQQNMGSSMSQFPYNGNSYDNLPKLNKNLIVEKPNSLNDDTPPYDPVKEAKLGALNKGAVYDPWGKPGAGAPLIDPDTGKKFTKYSGQLWYDTIGLTPSARERHRSQAVSTQNLNIQEQKLEMEAEKIRRQQEELAHRGRAGDVATWIQDIESSRWPLRTHLNHTNVTREKINLEYARRGQNPQTKSYHDELGLQLEERERQNKLYKLRDDVAGIEHTRHWNDWWGRPGGGAPNPDRRRHELNDQLESPRFWERNMSSQAVSNSTGTSLVMNNTRIKPSETDDGKFLFTKGTVRSNHKNHYENVEPMK